eukprot:10331322-Alexandrium_andersonii.AAC.1
MSTCTSARSASPQVTGRAPAPAGQPLPRKAEARAAVRLAEAAAAGRITSGKAGRGQLWKTRRACCCRRTRPQLAS